MVIFIQNKEGIVMIRTATLVILALYSHDMYPSICAEAVEKLGEMLKHYIVYIIFETERMQNIFFLY